MRSAGLLTLGLALVAASTAAAQAPGRIPIPYRTYVALNPVGIPADIVSGEIESGVAQGLTVGAVASYMSLGDDTWTTGDVKLRYYPGEVVLRGFSVGLTLGLTNKSTVATQFLPSIYPPTEVQETHPSLTFPTVGAIVDYNWMLGARQRFLVGTGFGAKRVLAAETDRAKVDLSRAYMTARFVVGVAF